MECMTCVCVWLERGGRCWGEWVTELGLGFTNSGGTWEKWDMCLRFGCGGVGGFGGTWVGGLGHGLGGWCGVLDLFIHYIINSCCLAF